MYFFIRDNLIDLGSKMNYKKVGMFNLSCQHKKKFYQVKPVSLSS